MPGAKEAFSYLQLTCEQSKQATCLHNSSPQLISGTEECPLCVTGPWSQGKVDPGTTGKEQFWGLHREGNVACRGALDDPGWRAHDGLPPARRQKDRWPRGPLRWIAAPGRDRLAYQSHPSLPALYVNFQHQDVLGQLSGAWARGGACEKLSEPGCPHWIPAVQVTVQNEAKPQSLGVNRGSPAVLTVTDPL